ncbi:MAG TPA: GYF domain-containing protein [Tepidisphaeraceae bacterium]|jgi:hypothetical protein|nr:GYF domain-containing protein [Tepidisphaeraceae bacterium]
MVQWYYVRDGRQVGPFDQAAIAQMFASGQIAPADLVWNEGMANWQPAGMIAELVNLPAPSAQQPAGIAYPVQPGFAPQGQAPPPPGFTAQTLQYGGASSPMAKSYKGLAIGGFVTSLAGLPCFVCVNFAAAPTGLVLSWVALSGMQKSGNPDGRGLAIAGVVIGAVNTLIAIAWIMMAIISH